ncbi:MAG TPA: TetR/AcrR family transcriptional regulator [Microbacteriaceae bacterium]
MSSDARQRLVVGTMQLLARRGLGGTSFADVVELTGAPRGSIYHYFPGGKDELVQAAIDLANENALTALSPASGKPVTEVTKQFLGMWRELLARSSFTAGCSVLAVTVAAESAGLIDHAGEIFRRWRRDLAGHLTTAGLGPDTADAAATFLIAASEGAVVLARAERSMEPFNVVSTQLLSYMRQLENEADTIEAETT